jgi:ABC-type dipeptide/oligopeptide/nickel transport system permease component
MGRLVTTLLKTIGFYLLVILGATFVMYTLLWAAPGDLVDVLCPRGCTPEIRAQFRQEWRLDRPLWEQYGRWLYGATRFRFGTSVSLRQGAPVAMVLKPAIRKTTILVFGAALLTLVLALFMAWRPGTRWRRFLLRIFQYPFFFLSFTPLYILAYWAVMLTSRVPHWLVAQEWLSKKTLLALQEIDFLPFGQQVSDEASLFYLAIPFAVAILLLALGNNNLAEQASSLRAEIDQLKQKEFIQAVRARGASVTKHLLHNMLLPLTNFFTSRAILLLGTVVIIETVMNITGVGWLLWEATKKRDTPMVLAIALFATVVACLLQMLNEIALTLIDPRLRKRT